MNQYTWTYVAGGGRNYNVGLYHGSKSGHLVIYVGSRIVALDFKVLESKEYTFFIEDELCHIQLERRGGEMFYHFNIDRKANTPRNRARNAMERKFVYQLLLALLIFMGIIGAFFAWSYYAKKKALPQYTERQLLEQGVKTVGKVTFYKEAKPALIFFQFVAGTQAVSGSTSEVVPPNYWLENGMPLETGDEFTVVYATGRPDVSRMEFGQPTERQLALYQQRAAQRHADLHPSVPTAAIVCLVKTAYQLKGVPGLADFFFQDASFGTNPAHNRTTYQQLVSAADFKAAVQQCR